MQQRGFTMIELMITVAIAAVLMSLAVPSMRLIVDNTKVKGAAESILSGLRLARAEAIKRNAPMRFQLVSALTSACAYSASSSLWVVSQTDQANYGQVAGKCNQAPAFPPDPCTAPCADNPYIAYKSQGVSSTDASVVVAARAADGTSVAVVTFGPLGQVLANLEGTASLVQFDASSTNTSAKPWRVRVAAPGGSIKFCDPALAAGQPLACS